MRPDILNNFLETQVVDPVVISADANGASVDMTGCDSVTFYALVGESGDTLSGSVYIELEVETSPDNSAWTDAPDVDIRDAVVGTNPGTFGVIDDPAEDDAVYKCQYIGIVKWVRPVINVTGTHAVGTPIGIVAIRTKFGELPNN